MLAKTERISFKSALTVAIALVWLINGLYCKVLHLVPRHQLIVARILGEDHAGWLTPVIGGSEVLMAAWILSGIRSRWCALAQAFLVALMNSIEYVWAPDLLLFGRANAVVALFFIAVVLGNEFIGSKAKTAPHLITPNP